MPIVFQSKLDSATANATFMDRTVNTDTVGVLSLNEPSTSGATISNAQLEINKSRKVVFGQATISNGDQLTPDSESMFQEFRLIGNGGAVVLNILPFDSQPIDGTEITLVGHDDTSTVQLSLNDTQYGAYINGVAVLKRGYVIKLVYNDELERYIETGRNF